MDKQALLQKTEKTLTPFETENIIQFLKGVTLKSAMETPWLLGLLLIIAFFAIVKRSRFVLAAIFVTISMMLLIRYTIPAEGDQLSAASTLPFSFGALAIGGILIYYFFIKTE